MGVLRGAYCVLRGAYCVLRDVVLRFVAGRLFQTAGESQEEVECERPSYGGMGL